MKNEVKTVYNSIYYDSQSKMNEKWVRKMKWKQYIIVYTMILSQKLSEKWIRKMTEEYIVLYTILQSKNE